MTVTTVPLGMRRHTECPYLRGGCFRLLVQRGLAHDGILAGHPSSERALNLGPESQLIQVVGLLCCRNKPLFLEGLVLETLQAIGEMGDVGQPGITTRETAGRALRSE